MNWDDLRHVLAVARTRNLTDAARHLGTSASTVSRRVAALEGALGRALFHRRRDGYVLTAAGEALLPDAEEAEARIRALQRRAGGASDEATGVVRLATPELIAHEVILPRLAGFLDAHPGLALEISADVRPVKLARQEADVVVRAVRPTQGSYTMRRIATIPVGLFAAPAYLARAGAPAAAAELGRHRVIGWDDDLSFLAMARWLEGLAGDVRPALRTTTFTAQLIACRAACGLAALPVFLGQRYGLVPVLADAPALVLDVWLIVRVDVKTATRVRAVCDFVEGALGEVGRAAPDG